MNIGPGGLSTNRTAYEFDYFSGSQIGIYIGDLLIDDIESIQFTATQTKRPVYGYASTYYHKVADGQVLAEGAFSIPFKEADYILAALKRYRDTHQPISTVSDLGVPAGGPQAPVNYRVMRDNIERRMALATQNEGVPNYDLYNDLAALPDTEFERTAETFEDILWKAPGLDFLSPNLTSNSRQDYDALGGMFRRADQYPEFDIYILYGDIANAAANHTIKRLVDVSIVGQGQTISVGGEPIREFYRFIAKNLA